VTRIALLGAGRAGAQIGAEFALGGCSVLWRDRDAEGARLRIEEALRTAAQYGLARPAEIERARALIEEQQDDGGQEGRLALIVEALPEQIELKAAVTAEVAARHPEALVASVSRGLSASEIARAASVPERMIAARYGTPPLLTPLVELAAAADTPPRLVDRVSQLLRAIGKRPVVLRGEIPGLISGRLEQALARESAALLAAGVASAEAIDEVVRDGLARGWRVLGPIEAMALDGPPAMAPELAPHVPAGEEPPGGLRERRDAALAAALRAERDGRPSEPDHSA
jgi:3-hydroxybutyryl-CoA dehydrogenase